MRLQVLLNLFYYVIQMLIRIELTFCVTEDRKEVVPVLFY